MQPASTILALAGKCFWPYRKKPVPIHFMDFLDQAFPATVPTIRIQPVLVKLRA